VTLVIYQRNTVKDQIKTAGMPRLLLVEEDGMVANMIVHVCKMFDVEAVSVNSEEKALNEIKDSVNQNNPFGAIIFENTIGNSLTDLRILPAFKASNPNGFMLSFTGHVQGHDVQLLSKPLDMGDFGKVIIQLKGEAVKPAAVQQPAA
jgi:hypothetical protein